MRFFNLQNPANGDIDAEVRGLSHATRLGRNFQHQPPSSSPFPDKSLQEGRQFYQNGQIGRGNQQEANRVSQASQLQQDKAARDAHAQQAFLDAQERDNRRKFRDDQQRRAGASIVFAPPPPLPPR